jgi:hypothetical protein
MGRDFSYYYVDEKGVVDEDSETSIYYISRWNDVISEYSEDENGMSVIVTSNDLANIIKTLSTRLCDGTGNFNYITEAIKVFATVLYDIGDNSKFKLSYF